MRNILVWMLTTVLLAGLLVFRSHLMRCRTAGKNQRRSTRRNVNGIVIWMLTSGCDETVFNPHRLMGHDE